MSPTVPSTRNILQFHVKAKPWKYHTTFIFLPIMLTVIDTVPDTGTHAITQHHFTALSFLMCSHLYNPFPTPNGSVDPAFNASHLGPLTQKLLLLLYLTKTGWNEKVLVSWLVLVNIVPNRPTGLFLVKNWFFFQTKFSILFSAVRFCPYFLT